MAFGRVNDHQTAVIAILHLESRQFGVWIQFAYFGMDNVLDSGNKGERITLPLEE